MITLTRRDFVMLRRVIRQSLLLSRSDRLMLWVTAGSEGMKIECVKDNLAIRYQSISRYPTGRFSFPYDLLAKIEARNDAPVQFELEGDQLRIHWTDRNVPREHIVTQNVSLSENTFPDMPQAFVTPREGFLSDLHDAMQTTDDKASRFAMSHVLLSGETGQIVSTDGHQALVVGGMNFPWEDNVLIPRTDAFGCKELHINPPKIGRTDDWVAIRTGPWTVAMKINREGKYPSPERIIPKSDEVVSRLVLDSTDAEFLQQTLPSLPEDDPFHHAITLDLNGSISLRAKDEATQAVTEAILQNSRYTGEPVQTNMNRTYLQRAIKLGFRQFGVTAPEKPLLCEDANRCYFWALLAPKTAIKPTDEATKIFSPSTGEGVRVEPPKRPASSVETPIMPAVEEEKSKKIEQRVTPSQVVPPNVDLIARVEQIRDSARELASATTLLLRSLRENASDTTSELAATR